MQLRGFSSLVFFQVTMSEALQNLRVEDLEHQDFEALGLQVS